MKIQASCNIRAPKSKVFAAFSDLSNLAKHVDAITNVEITTPGEVGVGTEFKETRVMFGKEATETMRITEFSPPDRLVEEADSGGMHYVSEWTFTEADEETTVSISFTGEATTLMAKVTKLIFSMMAGSMKKAFRADMEDMKKVLEN